MTAATAYRDDLRRVLHVAAISLPHTNGYTMRLRSILAVQRAAGCELRVVTSPFYPGRIQPPGDAVIDGVEHARVRHPAELEGGGRFTTWLRSLRRPGRRRGIARVVAPVAALLEERLLARRFAAAIVAAGAAMRAQLVHVHTPYRVALPAIAAARRLGVPVVYEVRGMWEDTAVSDGLLREDGFGYRYIRGQETKAMRAADAVVTLCEQLAAEVRSRGVAAERVFVASNGADLDRLAAAAGKAPSAMLVDVRRRIAGRPVVGYVGSLRPLEGVDQLLRAVAQLRRDGRDVAALVVGGGEGLEPLRRLAQDLGLGEAAILPGPAPADEVGSYYDLIDVFVVSRPSSRVTDLVTPIKPLEAMGRAKAVVMSDLPALRELGEAAGAAEYFRRGDPADLARRCASLLDDADRRRQLGERARRWVESERRWERTLAVAPAAYAAAHAVAAERRR